MSSSSRRATGSSSTSAKATRSRLRASFPLTPRMKKIFELALEDAQALGHNAIGTQHLLIALLHEGQGAALDALRALGAPPEDVWVSAYRQLGVDPPPYVQAGLPSLARPRERREWARSVREITAACRRRMVPRRPVPRLADLGLDRRVDSAAMSGLPKRFPDRVEIASVRAGGRAARGRAGGRGDTARRRPGHGQAGHGQARLPGPRRPVRAGSSCSARRSEPGPSTSTSATSSAPRAGRRRRGGESPRSPSTS